MFSPMGQIYFDESEGAAELVAALEGEGYVASLRREAFAGEDDSDEHAWVLVVDPFDHRVVEMVDVYGGWHPPAEPKRLKNPPGS